jgi:hypothetical protein
LKFRRVVKDIVRDGGVLVFLGQFPILHEPLEGTS